MCNKELERLGRLPLEEKILMGIDMTDFAVQVCAGGIEARNPNVNDTELLESLKERILGSKYEWKR